MISAPPKRATVPIAFPPPPYPRRSGPFLGFKACVCAGSERLRGFEGLFDLTE